MCASPFRPTMFALFTSSPSVPSAEPAGWFVSALPWRVLSLRRGRLPPEALSLVPDVLGVSHDLPIRGRLVIDPMHTMLLREFHSQIRQGVGVAVVQPDDGLLPPQIADPRGRGSLPCLRR